MRVLCLIGLTCPPGGGWRLTYEHHEALWHRVLDACPWVDGFFVKADPDLLEPVVEGRYCTVPGDNQDNTGTQKAILAIRHLMRDHHDVVITCSISSMFDFPLLARSPLGETGYEGYLIDGWYVTGSGTMMSRAVAELLSRQDHLGPNDHRWSTVSDIAITQIMRDHGIPATHRDWFLYDYSKGPEQIETGKHVHFRLRDYNDPLRVEEREAATAVFKRIYGNRRILLGVPCFADDRELVTRALRSFCEPDVDVVAINNGGGPAVKAAIEDLGDAISVIRNPENIYVNPAWNQLAARFLASDSEILVIANDDLVVNPGWSDSLLQRFDLAQSRGDRELWFGSTSEESPSNVTASSDAAVVTSDVRGTAGYFFALSREAVEAAFPIPPELVLYYGDTWIHTLLEEAGFAPMVLRGVLVWHRGSVSCNRLPELAEIVNKDRAAWDGGLEALSKSRGRSKRLASVTLVTAFFRLRDRAVDEDVVFRHFDELAACGMPILLFLDRRLADRLKPHPNVRVELRDLAWALPHEDDRPLPENRTEGKDTRDWISLQNAKLDFLLAARGIDESSHFAWIDFSVMKFVRDAERFRERLRALKPPASCVVTPGCWTKSFEGDVISVDNVHWRFCGSFLLADRDSIPTLANKHREVFRRMLMLTWEVNVWAVMEQEGQDFGWYKADHDDTLIASSEPLLLTRDEIQSVDLERLRPWATGSPEGFYDERTHYRLLAHMSTLGNGAIFDIGTNHGDSALALSYGGNRVESFDIVDRTSGHTHPENVHYHHEDLFDPPVRERWRERLLDSAIVFIDIDPHDGVLEIALVQWLQEHKYPGLIVLDDIHYFAGMREKCWALIEEKHKTDVTALGHWSGTGIVSFDRHIKVDMNRHQRRALAAQHRTTGTRPTGEPHICLNMIVKNEAKIIERCLTAALPSIDTWVITDTGSTDGTSEIITKFFAERSLPGSLVKTTFQNFAQARNEALDAAMKTGGWDYLLLIDADMVLSGEIDRSKLTAPAYRLMQRDSSLDYRNTRLVRRDVGARYHGVTHEYLSVEGVADLDGLFIDDRNDGGSKSDKSERDIRLLVEGLVKEPENARYMFYLAETYRNAGRHAEAIPMYRQRIAKGGWDEEVWYAHYAIARSYLALDSEPLFVTACMDAYNVRPSRGEPLKMLARYYRERGKNAAAVLVAEALSKILQPKDVLFVERDVYDFGADQEIAIAGYYAADKSVGYRACSDLTVHPREHVREEARGNFVHYVKSADELFGAKTQKIDWTPGDDYAPMNPSVCIADGRRLVLVRTVNYTVTDQGQYPTCDGTGIIKTRNHVLAFDESWKRISSTEIQDVTGLKRTDFPVEGFEDCRLWVGNGDLCASATVRDLNDGRCEQAILTLDGQWRVVNVDVIRDYEHDKTQKNWMPIVGAGGAFLYSCEPTIVVDRTSAGTFERARHFPSVHLGHQRGGSQLIEHVSADGDGWLCLVHEVIWAPNRHYWHRFVRFDREFKIVAITDPFYFVHRGIEFCAGLTRDRDQLVASFGVNDASAHLAFFDPAKVDEMLNEVVT